MKLETPDTELNILPRWGRWSRQNGGIGRGLSIIAQKHSSPLGEVSAYGGRRGLSLLSLILFLALGFNAEAQWMLINQNGGKPDPSAALEVSDTARGFLPPRLTTSQMNAVSSPASGLFVYNTDSNKYFYFDGAKWESLDGISNNSDTLDENVFSARISNTGTIISQSSNFISTVNKTGTGSYYVVWSPGFFSVAPSVNTTGDNNNVTANTDGVTDSLAFVRTYNGFTNIITDYPFQIIVQRQGSDYRYNTSGASASATASSSADSTRITDADSDTYIKTESSSDNDSIIMSAGGKVSAIIDGTGEFNFVRSVNLDTTSGDSMGLVRKNGLPFLHTYQHPDAAFGRNLYLGENAGSFDHTPDAQLNTGMGWQALTSVQSASSNAAFGYRSMDAKTRGNQNTAIGYNSMRNDSIGFFNTGLGASALRFNNGIANTAVGHHAMRVALGTGKGNTGIGASVLYWNQQSYNVAVGDSAGFNNITGSGNIFIGTRAGYLETGSNKLYIANDSTSTPLIYGDFDSDSLRFGGAVRIADELYVDSSNAGAGKVLTSDANGKATWQTPSAGSALADADNDTKIQVEESSDEDKIRFDLGGTEFFVMDTGRLEILNSGGTVAIGDRAGESDDHSNNLNVFIGSETGKNITTGAFNIAIGASALSSSAGGGENVAIGFQSLLSNSLGGENVAVGNFSLLSNTSGKNTAIGLGSSQRNTSGSYNVSLGYKSNAFNQQGAYNTIIGAEAGYKGTNHDKSGSVMIGYQAGYHESGDNKLYISNDSSSFPLIYGDFANDSLRFNANAMTLSSNTSGDATLLIEADSDNSNENDNPSILLSQDGGGNTGFIGLVGDANSIASGAAENALIMGTIDKDIQFYTSGVVRMTIDNNSNEVGIGTTTPTDELHVVDSTGGADLRIETFNSSSTANLYLQSPKREWRLVTDTDGKLRIQDEDLSEYPMIFDKNMNVGIGEYSPSAALHITDTAPSNANGAHLLLEESSGNTMTLGRASSYGFVQSHNAQPLSLNPLGNNVGIGTTSPATPLHVLGSTAVNSYILAENTTRETGFQMKNDNADWLIYIDDNTQNNMNTGSIGFYDENKSSTRMVIDSAGNMGVGSTSPGDKLDVDGGIDADSINVAEINSPSTGGVNLLPVAMGRIASGGAISGGTGNFTVSNPSAGRYVITISGISVSQANTTVMAIPEGNSANSKTINYDHVSGSLEIYTRVSGALAASAFSFMVYQH